MRNSFSFITLALAASLFVTSCRKHHREAIHTTKVVNATLEMNKPYQFDLGIVSGKESAKITEQAKHYLVSETSNVDGESHMTYNYTPALNYTGTDEAAITVNEGRHECGEHHDGDGGVCDHSKCHHDNDNDGDDNTTTYIIKITINRSPVSTANSAVINTGTN